jgi:alanine racemase
LKALVSGAILEHMNTDIYSTWLEIDLGVIKNNIKFIKEITGTQIMAVIKANGYGHGVSAVAKAVTEAGAEWCGVARMEEAIKLRLAGVESQILVLGYAPPELIPEAIQKNIHVAIYDVQMARDYDTFAKGAAGRLTAHLKVETGMGRLGMPVDQVLDFLTEFRDHQRIDIDGIYTHFGRADEPDVESTNQQLACFNGLLDRLRKADVCPDMIHAANSAAILNYPEAYYDLVRPGIIVYGLAPSPSAKLPDNLSPALTWKARLTSVRRLPPGHGVSYGAVYVTNAEERIGVIPVGYGDGFRRVPGQQALVRGQRVDVVGRVCMDQCMLQLDAVPDAVMGDEVVLLGRQGAQEITADDLAARWDTLNYEVVCALADRLPRVYYES